MNYFKLGVLSAFIGLTVGALCALFGRVLIAFSNFNAAHFLYLVLFLPFVGLAIVYAYTKWGKGSDKGMQKAFDAATKEGEFPKRLVPLIMLSTWAAHLFGASVGREGVAVQMGACIAHNLGKLCKKNLSGINQLSEKLIIIGMAAGFAGLFRVPLAATLFAIEVIRPKRFNYKAAPFALIAAFAANYASKLFGLEKFEVAVHLNPMDIKAVFAIVLLGIFFGLCGRAFAVSLKVAKAKAQVLFQNSYLRMFVLSATGVVLLLLCGGRYAGLGTNLIGLSLHTPEAILPFDFAAKFLFTVLFLAAGFQGGEVTPLFAMGASLGAFVGPILGLDPVLAAALGYAAVFSAATNTTAAPILIVAEVFGFQLFTIAALCVATAAIVSGERSIYPQLPSERRIWVEQEKQTKDGSNVETA